MTNNSKRLYAKSIPGLVVGSFIKSFYSIAEVARQTKIHSSNITKACLGKNKSACGYIWSYT